ncbi:MAG TPA: phosphoglucosamine mutase [Ilumatobacteraceae bacterium]|nr:phosphoglucosamine mutase [Ilumatobacteraceae bacterium]
MPASTPRPLRFGTDGVRGIAGVELTTEFAQRLGRAAAEVLGSSSVTQVVIGGDTRESTPSLSAALAAGFSAAGVEVISLGVAPTPMVAFEAQRRGCLGAVVSASHNPFHDNGIKLFAAGGRKLSDDVETLIEEALHRLDAPAQAAEPAALETACDPGPYVDHVLSYLEGRRLDGMRIVVDTANGAAHAVGPAVLRAAGADVVVIADRPDGRNINDGCGATVPSLVAAAVLEHGADAGVALDGDADRLIAVDHTGAVVDGDHIIAIVAGDLRSRGELRDETVVVTVMSNLGFRLAMQDAGIAVVETGVGDRYVLEALAAGGYSLGGEQSGHVIFADHATTGDGVLTAVALLDAVRRAGRPLAELARQAMTSLPQVLVNVEVATRVPDVADRLADDIARVEAQLGGRGRVLVRPSGTEPLVRVMVEAPTPALAQRAAEDLAAVLRGLFV